MRAGAGRASGCSSTFRSCASRGSAPAMITARRWVTVLLGVALASSVAAPASGAVRRLVVESRDDVLGARPFGNAGPYEKLTGIVEFALDPAHAANAAIVDLSRAPRDASGRVTASARVPWRAAEIDNGGVGGMGRVEGELHDSGQLLVGAGVSEWSRAEHIFARLDDQAPDGPRGGRRDR